MRIAVVVGKDKSNEYPVHHQLWIMRGVVFLEANSE